MSPSLDSLKSSVSIIMPLYNGANFVVEAVESVIRQSHRRWQLVVVDDGSTDNSAAIVQAYRDQRIRYVYQSNRGQAAALNHGIRLADGDYITTLDADDFLTPSSLFDRVRFLDANQSYGAVYADGSYCEPAGRPFLKFSANRPQNPIGDVYDDLLLSCFFATGAPVMVRRDVIQHLRPPL